MIVVAVNTSNTPFDFISLFPFVCKSTRRICVCVSKIVQFFKLFAYEHTHIGSFYKIESEKEKENILNKRR